MSLEINQITRQTGPQPFLCPILLLILLIPVFSQAQQKTTSPGGRLIICMIQFYCIINSEVGAASCRDEPSVESVFI
jgi:hypothetical protein